MAKNACSAETFPGMDGVPPEYCDAPCEDDYCPDHQYLDMVQEYAGVYEADPDDAYDTERERYWD